MIGSYCTEFRRQILYEGAKIERPGGIPVDHQNRIPRTLVDIMIFYPSYLRIIGLKRVKMFYA